MPFPAKTVDEIRAAILTAWQSRYAAADPPRALLVSPGSDAWKWAQGLAVIFQGLSARAEENSRNVNPLTATDAVVQRFSGVYNVPPRPPVAAQLTATVTGAPSTTVAIPTGAALAWTDGTLYAVTSTSVTLDGAGAGTVALDAMTAGASTSRDVGDVLTWQSAPAGLNPTATVASITSPGADGESVGDLAMRIIGRLRERPASGNAADWRAWCQGFTAYDIRDVWVYGLLQPPEFYPGAGAYPVLGCVTAVCAGPPQGDSPTNTRRIGSSGAALDLVKAYIEGLIRGDGMVITDGEQLRPVTMRREDYGIETITEQPVDVEVEAVMNTANAFSWTWGFATIVSSTQTSLVVTGDLTSDPYLATSKAALVNVGTANYRGGYYRVVLPLGVYDGGTNRTTFDLTATPLPAAPTGHMYSAPGNWQSLRQAAFSYFDALGPGDTVPPSRFPPEETGARSTLYPDALGGLLAGVPGALVTSVTLPASAETPPAKTVLTLGTFLVVPAP